MHRRLGISYQSNDAFPVGREQLRYARASGFLSVELSLREGVDLSALVGEVRAEGMTVSSLHLPRDPSGALWREETDEETLYSAFGGILSDAARAGIGIVCFAPAAHKAPPVRQFALARLARICRMAEMASVRLAFENDGAGEHFTYTVRSFCRGYHGVCFRPAAAYREYGTTALFPEVKEHLLSLSLSDMREGKGGLLPFDGDIDLAPLAASLADIPYRGVISLRPRGGLYAALGYDGLARRAYDSAHRFARMCDDAEGVI